MTHHQIRQKFADFFLQQDHKEVSCVPLVAKYDPSTLFTSAGMQPLTPYLLGKPHPLGKRLFNTQPCLRTDDIDEVGNERHLTFFEMLGNWSLGDYFKKEQLMMAFEFLTSPEWLSLDPERLFVSVFAGDEDAPRDEESVRVWSEIFKKAGIKAKFGERIAFYPKEKNWWIAGNVGPCGTDSEIFYRTDKQHNSSFGKDCHLNCGCGQYVEVWNNVFMEYNRTKEGKYLKLSQKNVDTGIGFERLAMVMQGKADVYETDLFRRIVDKIVDVAQVNLSQKNALRSLRIVADHLRASTFLLAEGVVPSNKQEGYILRRLLRRAITHGVLLGVEGGDIFYQVYEAIVEEYSDIYHQLPDSQIPELMKKEHASFLKTLQKGLRELSKAIKKLVSQGGGGEVVFPGKLAFDLEATYGLPLETQKEVAERSGVRIDENAYQEAFRQHQEISRAGAEGKFGKVEEYAEEKIAPLHTATHLLNQALRDVLGEQLVQAGQSLTPERIRFDFTFDQRLTKKELAQIEKIVNNKIRQNLPVEKIKTSYQEAIESGAQALFREKYRKVDKVTKYEIGEYSKELCGGPHVTSTGEIKGRFKIVKEESVGKGVRRIRAVIENR